MTRYRLGLSLSIVGAREKLVNEPLWPMALRVTVGTELEPATDAERLELIGDTLPWNVWPQALPRIKIVDEQGAFVTTCDSLQPLPEDPHLLAAIQQAVVTQGQRLATSSVAQDGLQTPSPLTFAFGGTHQPVDDSPNGDVPWPGLVNTLTTIAQPTASALKATWFFYLPRANIALTNPNGDEVGYKTITAAPAEVNGYAWQAGAAAVGGVQEHSYGTPDVIGYCQSLSLGDALSTNLDELDNYWLTIDDTRNDSVLDLASRIDGAVDVQRIVGSLSIDEVADACVEADGPRSRHPTLPETKLALDAWKALAAQEAKDAHDAHKDPIADSRKALLAAALPRSGTAINEILDEYLAVAQALLQGLVTRAAFAGTTLGATGAADLCLLARARLLENSRRGAPVPCVPGEGISLRIGDERYRLLHEDQKVKGVDDVAAIQLFGRRSSDLVAIDAAPGTANAVAWHALTGARYRLADPANPGNALLSSERVLGMGAGYVDGVLYRELSYGGANLVCRNPLEEAHRQSDSNSDYGLRLVDLDCVTGQTSAMLALPLRYGDFYEFAASVVDRAGGMADELTQTANPWLFEPAKLEALDPPQRTRLAFLRRVPLADCNILPAPGTPWPQAPADVWLRCLEKDEDTDAPEGGQPATVLLAPATAGFRKSVAGRPLVPASYAFIVEPPRLDEHTLLRWEMPATSLPASTRKQAAKDLKAQLSDIFSQRDLMLATGSRNDSFLPRDPAVGAIGVRYTYDSGLMGQVAVNAQPLRIEVEEGAADSADEQNLKFTIAKGSFVMLEFFVLVASEDMARFDLQAIGNLLAPESPDFGPWSFGNPAKHMRAFKGVKVYAECATDDLPQLEASQLKLSPDTAQNVKLCYEFSKLAPSQVPYLKHCHQMLIESERWTWRNLPIPPRAVQPGADMARRLASGPPAEILDPARRDDPAGELVQYFDTLCSIDAGFVRREDVVQRFPRKREDAIPLFVDRREDLTKADYLRFRFSVWSRYLGVLDKPKRTPVGPCRIALPFRGDPSRIKPLKVLAVLPLTQTLSKDPRPVDPAGSTPFLLVLDETWFREYGIGERLTARIAGVKPEIEDDANEPPDRRYGPLPDHSVTPVQIQTLKEDLDCFGPFGFSLDRSGDQALANATAFVVYPPAGTPPHYNLFVELQRCLDLPTVPMDAKPLLSVKSDAIPLYTLPNSAELNPAGNFELTEGGGLLKFNPANMTLLPFKGAGIDVQKQYRYVLIVGRTVRDSGRAVDIFLPAEAVWLDTGVTQGKGQANWVGPRLGQKSSFTHGIVAEVLLNGRVDRKAFDPQDPHPLLGARDLKQLFKAMLPDTKYDAPGMFRRFSSTFPLTIK